MKGNKSLIKIEIHRPTTPSDKAELQKKGTYRKIKDLIWLFDIISSLPNLKELKLKNFYLEDTLEMEKSKRKKGLKGLLAKARGERLDDDSSISSSDYDGEVLEDDSDMFLL